MRSKLTTFAAPWLALALLGCGAGKPMWVGIHRDLEALVPAGTTALAGLRMEAVRETPVYQKWAAQNPLVDLDKFAKESGLDPRKDISELLLAYGGKSMVVMAKGSFHTDELSAALERAGAKRIRHGGRTLVGDEENAVVFVNASTAMAGPAASLRAVLDRRGTGVPAALKQQIQSIPPETQVWLAASDVGDVLGRVAPLRDNLGNLQKILASLQGAHVSFDLRAGVGLAAAGACRTEQDAKFIHDALRGLLGMGRLTAPSNEPELLRLYDAFQVTQQKNVVSIAADLPLDLLEKIMAKASRFAPPGASLPSPSPSR
jgi:hypothetical protein